MCDDGWQEVPLEEVLGTALQGYQMYSLKMVGDGSECAFEACSEADDHGTAYGLRFCSVPLFSRRHLLDARDRQGGRPPTGCPRADVEPVCAVGALPPLEHLTIARIERFSDEERCRIGVDEYYPGHDGIRVFTDECWELDIVFGKAHVRREIWVKDEGDEDDEHVNEDDGREDGHVAENDGL